MVEWIVSSSVLTAVVILLRFTLKGKISLRLQYFQKIDDFELDGAEYNIYKWDVAFIPGDPTKVGWAGGMWLDSNLRIRSLEQCTYFVTRTSGSVVDHEFLFWDLYLGPDEETGRINAHHSIVSAFTSRN